MSLEINTTKTIGELQKEFSNHFQYLKLEFFFPTVDESFQFTKKNQVMDSGKRINEISDGTKEVTFSINGNLKVRNLEDNFKNQLGIHVQVYRKSGNIWLQTMSTDEWTLSEQNNEGKELERILEKEKMNDPDYYHEQL